MHAFIENHIVAIVLVYILLWSIITTLTIAAILNMVIKLRDYARNKIWILAWSVKRYAALVWRTMRKAWKCLFWKIVGAVFGI